MATINENDEYQYQEEQPQMNSQYPPQQYQQPPDQQYGLSYVPNQPPPQNPYSSNQQMYQPTTAPPMYTETEMNHMPVRDNLPVESQKKKEQNKRNELKTKVSAAIGIFFPFLWIATFYYSRKQKNKLLKNLGKACLIGFIVMMICICLAVVFFLL